MRKQKSKFDKCNTKDARRDNARREETRDAKGRKGTLGNDLEWYVPNGSVELLNSYANLPWSNVLADGIVMDFTQTVQNDVTFSTPGVARFSYVPTIGSSGDSTQFTVTDAANQAAAMLYANISKHQSGAKNYDPADLMMYVLAMDSAFMLWSMLVRQMAVACNYSFQNRFTPNVILDACGIYQGNQDDYYRSLSDIRGCINEFASMLNAAPVPSVFPIIKRHQFLAQNIFLDRVGLKAQSYVFVPHNIYQFDDTGENGTELKVYDVVKNLNGYAHGGETMVSAIRHVVSDIMNPILMNSDIPRMQADILKAFGDDKLWAFPMIDESIRLTPVYSEIMLEQIHNATVYAGIIPGNIKQNATNGAIYQVLEDGSSNVLGTERVLNVNNSAPNGADVMYTTRLTMLNTSEQPNPLHGSEYIYDACIYLHPKGSVEHVDGPIGGKFCISTPMYYKQLNNTVPDQAGYTSLQKWIEGYFASAAFCKYPQFYLLSTDNQATQNRLLGFDLQNFTTISNSTLKNLHRIAIAGEFAIPFGINS